MCGMTHHFTINRVQLREVYDWKIDLSVVERSRPDCDRSTLLKLWNCQSWHSVSPTGALSRRCPRCGWAWWMQCPHFQVWEPTEY